MRFAPLMILALAMAACGPSGDDSTGDDTAGAPDANNNNNAPDANNNAGATQIGDTCTPDTSNPMGQGSCDAGFVCVSLSGGTNPWCTKACTPGAGDTCNTGYPGPGLANCFMGIDFDNNGTTDGTYCGVVCQDEAGGQICDSTTCDMTCPGSLACTEALTSGTPPMEVAKGCQ